MAKTTNTGIARAGMSFIKSRTSNFAATLSSQVDAFLRTGRRRKNILLVANNMLYAIYLHEVAKLFNNDVDVSLKVTANSKSYDSDGAARHLAAALNIETIGYTAARFRYWDAVFFASPSGARHFPGAKRKVLVNHYLICPKIVDSQHWTYGPKNTINRKEPIFDLLLEPSHYNKNQATQNNPILENCIAVVGDIRSDRLLKNAQKRHFYLEKTESANFGNVILVQSTWGAASLVERFGTDLFEELNRIGQKQNWLILVSLHPNHWTGYANSSVWHHEAEKHESHHLRLIPRQHKWEHYMPDADLCVTDHTSNAAEFALLRRPIVFCRIPGDAIDQSSLLYKLYAASPVFNQCSELEEEIEKNIGTPLTPQQEEVIKDLLSFPGHSKEKTYTAIRGLLTGQ